MSDLPIFTYQTRPTLVDGQGELLDAYADLYSKAQRKLFAALRVDSTDNLKSSFQAKFGISSRQYNAMLFELQGKIDSIQSRQPDLILDLKSQIKKAEKAIAKLDKQLHPKEEKAKSEKAKKVALASKSANPVDKKAIAFKLHQKKRRLTALGHRLEKLEADAKAGEVRLCFGSKKLFHAQFDLVANGYEDHLQWKEDWQYKRSSQFFVLGSKDELAGCQLCQATIAEDGSLTLKLRLPDALVEQQKVLQKAISPVISIKGVRFAYGHEQIVAALNTSERINAVTLKGKNKGKAIVKRTGTALSYRFLRDDKGWRIFVSCQASPVKVISNALLGSVGVDVNADHLAVSEVDRFGNLIDARRIDLPVYGKSTEQAKAIISEAVISISSQAKKAAKPIVIEVLDFQKKKAQLEAQDPKYARMLSSFACNKVASSIHSIAFKEGVEVLEVNPAYTSVIGAVNYAQPKGISVHMGAALVIARRGLGLSEKPPASQVVVPTRNGGHVTFELPARNARNIAWSHWAKIRTRLKAAHVAHVRCGEHKQSPPPLAAHGQPLCPTRISTARFRGANRQQNCPADVLIDVPW